MDERLHKRSCSRIDATGRRECCIGIGEDEVDGRLLVTEVFVSLGQLAVVDVDIKSAYDCADRRVVFDSLEICVSHYSTVIFLGKQKKGWLAHIVVTHTAHQRSFVGRTIRGR